MRRRGAGRWVVRGLLGLVGLLVLTLAVALVGGWREFGRRATGERRARMEASPQWGGRTFINPQPLRNSFWKAIGGAFRASPHVSPGQPIPVMVGTRRVLERPSATGLRVTWFGHSSILLELEGRRVLFDPLWSHRASPFGWVGPQRWFPPPVALSDLPEIDAVVISHDHYDHLDRQTVMAIAALSAWNTRFVVPLGVGAHLAFWGVPQARIVELDWWERVSVGTVEIVSTPARHASGRMIVDDDTKLWSGYALVGASHRVYYSGDTGLFPAMREIGARLGPFDLTMIEVGQYGSAWPDWHLGPEQAVRAHQLVRGRVLLPVHWGALPLAYHAWTEPVERVLAAAAAAGATVVVPRPGQSIEPSLPLPVERWWPDLPVNSAAQDPIVSTQMD